MGEEKNSGQKEKTPKDAENGESVLFGFFQLLTGLYVAYHKPFLLVYADITIYLNGQAT